MPGKPAAAETRRLFHFSDRGDIAAFAPRPVAVPSPREPGREWLNGPLVWAIDDWHQPMYLFPRDCPRVLLWPTADTVAEDRATWWQGCDCRMIAHVEREWWDRMKAARLFRYRLPAATFVSIEDAGMWVSRETVEPIEIEAIDDLPGALAAADVELRCLDSFAPLRDAVRSSLHFSGIRLRNSRSWAGR